MRWKSYLGVALLSVALAGCESAAEPESQRCTGRRLADVTPSSIDSHSHSASVCEEDRNKSILLTLSDFDHQHNLGLNATEVNQILDGQGLSKASPNVNGHSHVVSFPAGKHEHRSESIEP